ncbi:hypothetical protein GI293_000652 [Vibrio fluvialis]|nr:hypothetical protein [Vibrio fluvialis]EKO3915509.1 hypothetical protein [Vibrio fluvialis]
MSNDNQTLNPDSYQRAYETATQMGLTAEVAEALPISDKMRIFDKHINYETWMKKAPSYQGEQTIEEAVKTMQSYHLDRDSSGNTKRIQSVPTPNYDAFVKKTESRFKAGWNY